MLAIIIPYYKITFFESTLESLANQTDKRFKVYIGDDASLEDCRTIIKKNERQFDLEYHRFDTNLGGKSLTKQWDRCIALSKDEEWIMILGDDDILGENVVEAFYENLEDVEVIGSNVIRFATEIINAEGRTISKVYQHNKLEEGGDAFWRKFKGLSRSSLSEHIFKKQSYNNNGFKNYPLGWHSDDYAWLTFVENKPIYCINEAVIKISVSSKSISGNNENLEIKNNAEIIFFKDLIKEKLSLFDKKAKLELLYEAEVAIKRNRKLSNHEWLFFAKYYLFFFSVLPTGKFIRRFLKK